MNMRCLPRFVVALILSGLPIGFARAEAPRTRAVLIGIDRYDDAQIQPRAHAEVDAKALHDLIRDERYGGAPAENVRLLVGADASREKVLAAVDWLVKESKPEDTALFFFFGQGAGLNKSGKQTGFLAKDSTIKDRPGTAVTCEALGEKWKKLACRRFGAFLDVRLTGYSAPAGEDEPTRAEIVRCFLGDDQDESPPGRFLALAGGAIRPGPDLPDHGLFALVLLAGLRGAADRDGGEADGLVTAEELKTYLEREAPALAVQHGKTRSEKEQVPAFISNPNANFVLARNPDAPKVRERLERFQKLATDRAISDVVAAEGRQLLTRMPKLQADRDLRKLYQQLADGTLAFADFEARRGKILAGRTLDRKVAQTFERNVVRAAETIEKNHIKLLSAPELAGRAVRGMYRQLEATIPEEIERQLADLGPKSKTTDVREILVAARLHLGKREDLDGTKDTDLALSEMCAKLDRYTTYIDAEGVRRSDQDIQARYSGIGARIRRDRVADALQIVTPMKGSPSYKAGLRADDLILAITRTVDGDGKPLSPAEVISTKGMTTDDAVKKVLGKAGTKVTLTVRREGEEKPFDVDLTRAEIEVETVVGTRRKADDSWDYWADPERKIGYIRVIQFSAGTAADLRKALLDLRKNGLKALILDLRFNPGGLLTSAIEISDLFIETGVIVTVKPRNGRDSTYTGKSDDSYTDFPVVCLVNGLSASASEIVSACLQDHHRAVIAGERSYGKGSVQHLYSFPPTGGKLKMTTATFWRPSGKNLNKASTKGADDEDWGVRPDPGFEKVLTRADQFKLQDHLYSLELIRRSGAPADKEAAFKDEQLDLALQHLRK
jgi:C-terminal peptidase prc